MASWLAGTSVRSWGRALGGVGTLAWLALATLPACSDDGGASPNSGPTLAELGATLAVTLCDVQKACLGPAFTPFAGTTAECRDAFTAEFNEGSLPTLKASIAAGKVLYTPGQVSACLAKINALGCAIQTTRVGDLCQAALAGQVAAGGECSDNAECGEGHFCDAQADCPGKCTARVAEGASCQRDESCQTGTVCASGKCARPAPAGSACDGGQTCVAGTVCTAKTCQAYATLLSAPQGSDCSLGDGSAKLCVEGLSCAVQAVSPEASFSCVAPVGSGAACKLAFPDVCPDGEFCPTNIALGKVEGTCTKRHVEGEDCVDGADNEGCVRGFRCASDKKCHAPGKNGVACKENDDCYGVCEKGVCAAQNACNHK